MDENTRVGLPFRSTLTGWRCADGNLMKFSNKKWSALHLERNHPPACAGGQLAGKQLCQKGLRSPGRQQIGHEAAACKAAKAANRSQAALGRAASRLREVILPFHSTLEGCVQCWVSQYKRGTMAEVQWRTTEMIKEPNICHTGEGWETWGGLASRRECVGRNLININTWWEAVKKMVSGSSQVCSERTRGNGHALIYWTSHRNVSLVWL